GRVEVLPALDERLAVRGEARALRLERVALDAVVRPRRHEQFPAVLVRQPVRLVAHHLARRLARPRDVRQRAGQLAVPRLEDVPPGAAVAELEPVVAALHDVYEPARRRRVRVVVHYEQPAVDVAAGAERVPEPGRHAAELLAVGRAVEDVPALTA